MKKLIIISALCGFVVVIVSGFIFFSWQKSKTTYIYLPTSDATATSTNDESRVLWGNPVVYKNDQYRFGFTLPESWKGYSIISGAWSGYDISGEQNYKQIDSGPILTVRDNTPVNYYGKPLLQEIPIMVFTLKQWDLVSGEKMSVSAAPFGPSEIGRNSRYVFAYPPRFQYADTSATMEVENIIHSNPFHVF